MREESGQGKNFLVFGAGLSGIGSAELLSKMGEHFVLFEGNGKLKTEEIRGRSSALENVEIFIGTLPEEVLEKIDVVVISPGIPADSPVVENFRQTGAEIWGEIELAYRYSKGRILAITGTNGKTTTTSLLGEIMKTAFSDVQVVGNIGIPFTHVAADTKEDTVIVAEISSFQLETVHRFCPEISAILNLTPDHLDRHHTMEEYQKAKENIAKNQTGDQCCILNFEDQALRKFGESLSIPVIYFSSERVMDRGLYLHEKSIWFGDGIHTQKICDIKELHILGKHNYENVMAACGMALSFGLPIEKIREALLPFQGVEHRIEFVGEFGGVHYYNDSKGTNPDAAIQGIRAMEWPTLLIAGGYDKGAEYGKWISSFDGKVKWLVLLGATAKKIAKTAKELEFPEENILFADDMEDAVDFCKEYASPGDAVLLSPACASWGMFRDYEERGRIFKELVKKL